MSSFLTFIIPVIMNCATGGIFFITAYRFSEAGVHKMITTGTMTVWAVIYALASLVVGHYAKPSRAYKMLLICSVALCLTAMGFLIFPSLYMQFVWIVLFAIVFALFTTPFQVYIKGLKKGTIADVSYSTCKYTISWSLGLALGAFLFSSMDWHFSYVLIAVFACIIFFGMMYIEKHRPCCPQEKSSNVSTVSSEITHKPDCALLGWILAGCGLFTISIVRTLEPGLALQINIPLFHIGLILAFVSVMQAVVSFVIRKRTKWYYDPKAVLLLGFCGAVGLLLYALHLNCWTLYMASFFYGIYSGMFYLLSIYHSLVHPYKSPQYVAVNEAIVGISGVLGSLFGGYLAQISNFKVVFGLCAVIVIVSSIGVAVVLHNKTKKIA
ncbi:MAG: MFS transporter [Lentisphaeria bacterium]